MTIRYVWSGATGAANGTSWTDAYTTLAAALPSNANGDLVYVADDHVDTLAADTIYTFTASVAVISVNRTSGLPSIGAFVGHTSTNYYIYIQGNYKLYCYGVTFQVAGSVAENIEIFPGTAEGHFEFESCAFNLTNTSGSSLLRFSGTGNSTVSSYLKLKGCTVRFGHASQGIQARNAVEFEGLTVNSAGTAPSVLFLSGLFPASVKVAGSDLSHVTGTLVGNATDGFAEYAISGCKLGSGVTVLAAQTTVPRKGAVRVDLYDCASGDQHYHIGHYDALGSTTVDTGIYANDGAQYDGTNRCSWKIVTTANCSFYTPYVSPWFGRYHSAASAITPYIEILRDGSTTAYQDDEVWGEFAAKTTTGSTQATFYSDRMTLLGTPANQAAGVGTSGWTGEAASAWSGKLAPGSSFTPSEVGHLMARVVVGEPSITVYVDPAIRGT